MLESYFDALFDSDRCTGCGTCVGVCQSSALTMKIGHEGIYKPVVNLSRCKKCLLCVRVCPLISTSTKIFTSLIGNYRSVYVAHSTDPSIRFNAASGGVITSLIAFLFDSHLIDGVITTMMREDHPLLPVTYIARNRQEFMKSQGSKYCPVHVNSALKQLFKLKGSYVHVGLPCHVKGVKSAESTIKEFSNRVFFSIGLFCSHTVNFYGTWFLLCKMDVNPHDVLEVTYRGKGWPGGMTIKLKSGKEVFVPLTRYWGDFFEHHFFTPTHCLLCDDGLNRFADISVGDAWLPELIAKKDDGESIIITRTKKGEKLLTEAVDEGYLTISKVSIQELLRSQRNMLSFKHEEMVRVRANLLRLVGKSCAYYRSSFKPIIYLAMTFPTINSMVTGSPFGARLLLKMPLTILKAYTRFASGILKRCFDV